MARFFESLRKKIYINSHALQFLVLATQTKEIELLRKNDKLIRSDYSTQHRLEIKHLQSLSTHAKNWGGMETYIRF